MNCLLNKLLIIFFLVNFLRFLFYLLDFAWIWIWVFLIRFLFFIHAIKQKNSIILSIFDMINHNIFIFRCHIIFKKLILFSLNFSLAQIFWNLYLWFYRNKSQSTIIKKIIEPNSLQIRKLVNQIPFFICMIFHIFHLLSGWTDQYLLANFILFVYLILRRL